MTTYQKFLHRTVLAVAALGSMTVLAVTGHQIFALCALCVFFSAADI
ncbi:hypothetical protein [Pararobbsia silviterrae]|nr:hypothetical protein [Pararobbsia silviterrae]